MGVHCCWLPPRQVEKCLYGSVGVAAPRDWSDLLHPKFKGRIAFPASSRGLVGIALKTLGLGFNSNANDLRAWGVSETALKKRVQELKRQALLFDDREHVRAFAFGDAWLVVGSSLDVMALSATVSQARLFVPASGTTLWADLFVQPSSSKATRDPGEPSPLIPAWLDFILSPSRSVTTTGLKSGLSPLLLPDTGAEGAPGQACGSGMNGTEGLNVALDVKGRFLPPGCVLQRSEFLLPLDRETTDLYNRMLG
ncbi:unnamed protein product [Ostreobium quekettii]|uniref:Uncharacterized protein n=1 Tax=Ostreobium quekettii TaxID=121088 RepID=A0A8S1IV08_9CHLO|nr:unnamed protein product [Ostreobium quekettii]